ncbi:TetR/AcrR family transcriptional regulator [Pyxidicoccus fallax]|uniref:TetR/AcrR family transcriptional regulator n=1 Tax=Pyxidicoccus fallax TaxID=394095 RepID=A0A848L9B7_9BACT|nr:TetR/AcrR family transcriptional regulator [Pyxidicoccus fallax]NMO13263.1 TetR/AcrR family transcriptional regulator [Pyxidicoccus fallax]NPC77169.1 TetR/AcrR family transcriptional regulator [Pyxidicoccus fallax]
MSDEISGRGDPLKSLQLLWGRTEAPRRGPKAKAGVADLVSAAVAIADAEGLDAVSTRRVADAVGISPMSFYTHIPGKAELLDLMMDAVAGEVLKDRPVFKPAQWRANLSRVATDYRDFYLAHPWVIQLATHRTVLGPNTFRSADVALSAVEGLGLTDLEMDRVLNLVLDYVHGAVRNAAREKRVKELTGMTDAEWWSRVEPFLETVDFSPYPVLSRVGKTTGETYGAHDPEGAFAFGLARVLDGLSVFIEEKTAKRKR